MAHTKYRTEVIGDAVMHLGDCREIIPTLDVSDLLLTDPPYGIAHKWNGGSGHGWHNVKSDALERNEWDHSPPDKDMIQLMLRSANQHVIWGGNYFELPPSRCWLIRVAPNRGFTLADAEMAWTSRDSVVRLIELRRNEDERVHPAQKPVKLILWCLSFFPDSKTVLDPFMGSGTTGVAALRVGKKFVGVEISEKYFDVACRRIEKEYRRGDFIDPVRRMLSRQGVLDK